MSKLSKAIETHVHMFEDGTAEVDASLRFFCKTKIHHSDAAIGPYIDYAVSNSRRKIIYEVFGEYVRELSNINALLWGTDDYQTRHEVSDRLMTLMDKMRIDEK